VDGFSEGGGGDDDVGLKGQMERSGSDLVGKEWWRKRRRTPESMMARRLVKGSRTERPTILTSDISMPLPYRNITDRIQPRFIMMRRRKRTSKDCFAQAPNLMPSSLP
jgi:hypothetical protein